MLAPSFQRTARHAQGFTLIELMVALLVGFIVLAAGVAVISSTMGSNSSALRMTRLNQDLRGILSGITADLRRAGSWALADTLVQVTTTTDLKLSGTTGTITARSVDTGSDTSKDAFTSPLSNGNLTGLRLVMVLNNTPYDVTIAGVTDASTLSLTVPTGVTLPNTLARVGSWAILNPFDTINPFDSNTTLTSSNCILFSYDLDADGLQDSNEHFGYRLVAGTTALQATTTDTSCTSGSGWQNISDEDVSTIQAFTFEQTPTAAVTTNSITSKVREYSVTVTAALNSDATVVRSLRSLVEVRNHSVHR